MTSTRASSSRADRADLERAGCTQSADGRLRNTVRPRKIGLHGALREALHRFLALVGDRLGGRPNFTPLAFARARPSPVLARIKLRSNSAKPASTVTISLPCGVVVSANGSASDLKPARALPMASRMLSRSRVDRASRSSRVTISVLPGASRRRTLASSARSVLAPLAFSK